MRGSLHLPAGLPQLKAVIKKFVNKLLKILLVILSPALKPACRTGRLCVGRTNNNRLITIVILNEAQRSEEPPYTYTGVSTRGFLSASWRIGMTIIIYLLFASYSFAQQSKIDSLDHLLKGSIHDTLRAKVLLELSELIYISDIERAE
ncbi:hypothetical protein JYU16_01895, partial [bacterium AH-315-M05]|nr:hypothetical protein [bacterium AH-315-M05]